MNPIRAWPRAHVPQGGGDGDMMTIGDRLYLIGGCLVVDVTDPKQSVIVNQKAPRGELAYNPGRRPVIIFPLLKSD
jgi:hypothetical protein